MHPIFMAVDSYKASHFLQLPPKTQHLSDYIESRGGAYQGRILFFGLQAFIRMYLEQPIYGIDVVEAAELFQKHGVPFNHKGWMKIVEDHDGYLPLEIEAIPEGTIVDHRVPLVQVRNTEARFPWMTGWVETALLRSIWAPTTVASRSNAIRQIIGKALQQTSDAPAAALPFKLHDFGARGVSSGESAGILGMGHLINFMGTDTVESLIYARDLYEEDMAGFSIPAAEHSTITSWGKDHEVDAYHNMIKQFGKPGAIVAVVSDSYDIWNAVDKLWGDALRQEVIDSGATIVVRPDSGDPRKVPIDVIEMLAAKFGYIENGKKFKVLPSSVRVIQGDGIDEHSIKDILDEMIKRGWSADNIAFGMGGQLLQGFNRDTCKFAMKASAIWSEGDADWRPIGKSPVTDPGKGQKFGRVAVEKATKAYVPEKDVKENLMRTVWRDGETLIETSLSEIRSLVSTQDQFEF